MDDSITYVPLTWQCIDGYWYLVRFTPRVHKVYGPFDEDEAQHAGEVWGVPFEFSSREYGHE